MATVHTIKSLDKQLVLTVKIKKSLIYRVWLGMQFVRFGAWIATLGFKIEDEG